MKLLRRMKCIATPLTFMVDDEVILGTSLAGRRNYRNSLVVAHLIQLPRGMLSQFLTNT